MTFRAWWRGWLARVWGEGQTRPRGRRTSVLVLDRLPERDVPSAVDDAPPPQVGVMWDAVGVIPPALLDLHPPPVQPINPPPPPNVPAEEPPPLPSVPPAVPRLREVQAGGPIASPASPPASPPVVLVPAAAEAPAPREVGPHAEAGVRSVAPDLSAFRISGLITPGETVRVRYTLAAHDATGTTAVSGTVTLTPTAGVATVPTAAVPTARPPELFTLVVGEQPALRPSPPSATLFVVPPPQAGDAALLEAHRAGRSAEAFNTLVRRHGPGVVRAAERVVGNRADAQDVSQRVFLELSRFRGRVTGTLTAWLRAVSRNTALAFLRAKRRRLKHELQAAKPEAVPPPSPPAVDEGLTAALAQLPPELGQAVRLRYLDGYTQQEAAELAGVPRGTLSRRAAEGVRVLRAILFGEDEGGERDGRERQ